MLKSISLRAQYSVRYLSERGRRRHRRTLPWISDVVKWDVQEHVRTRRQTRVQWSVGEVGVDISRGNGDGSVQ